MAVFLGEHKNVTRSEYNELKNKLDNALSNSNLITISNVQVEYNSTSKTYTLQNNNIQDGNFVSVYYNNATVASECGLLAEIVDNTIVFTFESEPAEAIVCTIVITKGGIA